MKKEHPEIPVVTTYDELKGYITEAVERMEPNSKKQTDRNSLAAWSISSVVFNFQVDGQIAEVINIGR